MENNWVQTIPEKGWFMILRLYGPLEPWFDKTGGRGKSNSSGTECERILFQNSVLRPRKQMDSYPWSDG